MKYILIPLFLFIFFACENHAFDRDKRQIITKNEIKRKLNDIHSFTVTGFKEDTLQLWGDSTFRHPFRYTIQFSFKDSTGQLKNKQGVVIFAPEGNAVINSTVIDRP